MSNILRKVLIGIIVFALGVAIGILYESIRSALYPEYVSVTLYDADNCDIRSVEIQSQKRKILEYVNGTSHYDKYTVRYHSKLGQMSNYNITVATENCGQQTGIDRQVYPGQVLYENVEKDGIYFQIRH